MHIKIANDFKCIYLLTAHTCYFIYSLEFDQLCNQFARVAPSHLVLFMLNVTKEALRDLLKTWVTFNLTRVRVAPGQAHGGKVQCAEGICQSSSWPAASLSLLSAAIKVNHLFQLVFATAIILCVQYEIRNYVALVMVLSCLCPWPIVLFVLRPLPARRA